MRSFFKKKDGGWKNALLKIKMRKKLPAFTLVATSLAVLAWILIAQSFAMMSSGAMDTAKTQRVTAQAVEAAKLDEAALRNIAYDEIDSKGPHGRRAIDGMDDGSWESSVTIDPERTLSDGEQTKLKMAHIAIFRTGDSVSRFTLDVPLVSSDFNVKNDDEKHRISEKYDEKHGTVDTYVDRRLIYDNVKNDSPGTRISVKYDGDTLKFYSGGNEIGAPVPKYDWRRHIEIVHCDLGQWDGNYSPGTYHVPTDGMIIVINCVTDCDYGLWIDGGRAYHKCGATMADTSSFPVAKGDTVYFDAWGNDNKHDPNRQLYITFVPVKKAVDIFLSLFSFQKDSPYHSASAKFFSKIFKAP